MTSDLDGEKKPLFSPDRGYNLCRFSPASTLIDGLGLRLDHRKYCSQEIWLVSG